MSGQEDESVEQEKMDAVADKQQEPTAAGLVDNESERQTEDIVLTGDTVEIEKLQAQLEKESEQAKANFDLVLRTKAEMENLRKRTARDIENAHKYALEKFVNELLPIIDSVQLGMDAVEDVKNIADLREGMALTLQMFGSVLEKFGVQTVDPQAQKFNPEQHEAVSIQEAEDTGSGMIVSVIQKGYELNGRLVRPAMVVVAK